MIKKISLAGFAGSLYDLIAADPRNFNGAGEWNTDVGCAGGKIQISWFECRLG